ncbi:alpha/beta hydrolase [Alloscardovia venturai]|uniref:Alpha/beta hydrolase n=1 Tax=Alloscardovia venturai TaxID=1769421 RepID=A0ABW2Y653_9BIFI
MRYTYSGAEWVYTSVDSQLYMPLMEIANHVGTVTHLSPQKRREIQSSIKVEEPSWISQYLIVSNFDVRGLKGDNLSLRDDISVPVRLYTPRESANEELPVLLCFHGGGLWKGDLDSEHIIYARLAHELRAVILSVDYRLAPEHPYPAGLHDCATALQWLADNSTHLNIDMNRLAFYGGSAGGNLALALAMYARDNGLVMPKFIMAMYPMIDDRHTTPSSYQITETKPGAWNRRDSLEAWRWYLADNEPDIYAAPARADIAELEGLPPVYMDVGTLDLFRDEDLSFATQLSAAGVEVEMHMTPRMVHGGENVAPDADISKRIWGYRMSALRRALGTDERVETSDKTIGKFSKP